MQTQDFARADTLFRPDYAYFSSVSSTWLKHAERYVADMVERFGLNAGHRVVEIAANDGYLLQYVQARGIPCLGIEPTAATAAAARAKGLRIVETFFGLELAETLVAQGWAADLVVANNVLAHVPDIDDFVRGVARLLKPSGLATFEFPHLLRLLAETQFDTLYHEHFSYLALGVVERIFRVNGLSVFDVEEWPTHGGSLRVYAQRTDTGRRPRQARVDELLQRERAAGLETPAAYADFQVRAETIRHALLSFLLQGRQVVGYGAAAKGNTLLNYAGVRPDLLAYVVDRNPAKQGRYLPGSRIPIVDESRLAETRPDYVLILPWNLRDEVMRQLAEVRAWGGGSSQPCQGFNCGDPAPFAHDHMARVAVLDSQALDSLKRAFGRWIYKSFIRRKRPGIRLPDIDDFHEVHVMLQQRVEQWNAEIRERGRLEGRQENQRSTALAMLQRTALDEATIAELTGLSVEEVRALRNGPSHH